MAYVDLQLNGYAGVDFNADGLTADALDRACRQLEADEVEACLATIITDDLDAMCRRLARLAVLRHASPLAARLIAGVHVEGPFLNDADGFRGAHPRDAIRLATVDDMARLLDAADGLVRLVTLAPECDPGLAVTRMLAQAGVLVSAGHTDASLDVLHAAMDAGLSMCTHVGNACPRLLPRHDNIIQRMLGLPDRVWLCFIADGVHVPFVALGNYLRLAGLDRAIVVTDGMAAAGLGPGRYTLGRWDLVVGDDLVVRAPDDSHLVGSAVSMKESAARLERDLRLPAGDIRRLTRDNPRTAALERR
jgi:N-acetylglucosamine-6-phosphate deacetylase